MRVRTAGALRAATVTTVALLALAVGSPASAAETTKVSVNDNYFKPKRVTVGVGDKVTWVWKGFLSHNVTVVKGPRKFKSKTQSDGRFSRAITKPGTYRIVCTIHPGMEMKLIARPETATTSAPPTT
jgi:plastocyanin